MAQRLILAAILALLLVGICSQSSHSNDHASQIVDQAAAFRDWKKTYNVKIEVQEEAYRRLAFKLNHEKIKANNEKNNSRFSMKMNKFGAMTQQEFKDIMLKATPPPLGQVDLPLKAITRNLQGTIAASKNWTAENAVTTVKDQGFCGSCYAFSSLAAMQSSIILDYGVTLDLSEQQVVDCSTTNNGCDGGSTWNAYLYSNGYGINVESSYPYTATKGACQLSTGPYKVQSVRYADGEDAMRSELQYRPYPVYVDSTGEAWQLYSNGVLDICNSSVNHAVLLVGYDVQHNWLIKNSWGIGWGMQGYVTLAAGNTCGIAIYRDYLAWL